MRTDLQAISQWITPGERVLDLGCGDGELLAYLKKEKQVTGYGMEIDTQKIVSCVEKGVEVIHQDLNDSLDYIDDQSFDTVLMTQSLQQTNAPDKIVDDMLRIGKRAIVTFPNFGHWTTRIYLGLRGMMPMSDALPFRWYDTPNIHFCTFKDFEVLCKEHNIDILMRTVVDSEHEANWKIKMLPNMLGEVALYHLGKK
ncbi:methionine biosynthesis protein MetW [Reinekea marina]|uniref:Methionine biosynthesis protein MetW n=1 Tax=Reinekea marina TaxID=1310421 RepID=A0ABV7WR97_9GAMM|nr:methionine biosynthesis protein MetW [Reinekea marina]MDN3650999.1 methionine biosynthesis protein MetW [Reinekea marina]